MTVVDERRTEPEAEADDDVAGVEVFEGLPLDRVRLASREMVDSGRPDICIGGSETGSSSRSFSVDEIVCGDKREVSHGITSFEKGSQD